MKQHNICEIGCYRIAPGAYTCSATKKVKVSKSEKEVVLWEDQGVFRGIKKLF